MPNKAVAPGRIILPNGAEFVADALPDPFDGRDLEYRPRLQPLPDSVDQRAARRTVLRQDGSSCTGHAVAAMVNTILAAKLPKRRTATEVSPYMLYRVGRRYDEFPGEADEGSSLRGVLKGWFRHGVALRQSWPDLTMDPEPDLDDVVLQKEMRDRPLGAFYRVNAFRLDDLQSAISEQQAVVVSGIIHDGWREPAVARRNGTRIHFIERKAGAMSLGGHAYVLVGYNEVGFLVQNSWGTDWGNGGFATLPYDEWLDSAYDAWVARPGVPQTPFAHPRSRTAEVTYGEMGTAPGPDLRRLMMHVVNLANDGRLSSNGKFISTGKQIDGAFGHMAAYHQRWAAAKGPRRIVLYAHGGVVSEDAGLKLADAQLNWWLNNRVYPLSFVWQSGPIETLLNYVADRVRSMIPFAAGFDIAERVDRLVEGIAGAHLRFMWEEMKDNARAAADPLEGPAPRWPPTTSAALDVMGRMPGASLVADRLKRYADEAPDPIEVHLVGHSAGSIMLGAFARRLDAVGVPVASLTLLGAAIRVDEFAETVLPLLGSRRPIRRFVTVNLADDVELDDTCAVGDFTFYNKSLLFLVSRAFERAGRDEHREVPLLGMTRFLSHPLRGERRTLRAAIEAAGGQIIVAPQDAPPDSRSHARGHGHFDNDASTMTSVVMQILRARRPAPAHAFEPHTPLIEPPPAPGASRTEQAGRPAAGRRGAAVRRRAGRVGGREPLRAGAAVGPPGEAPLVETPPPAPLPETAQPDASKREIIPEVADAPLSGSAVQDVLSSEGWVFEDSPNPG